MDVPRILRSSERRVKDRQDQETGTRLTEARFHVVVV